MKTVHILAMILVGLGTALPGAALKAPAQFAAYLVLAGILCAAVGGPLALATQPPGAKDAQPPSGGSSS